jgi:hypothetical protein
MTWSHPVRLIRSSPARSRAPTLSFQVEMNRSVCGYTNYGGTVSGNPPDQISGSASCDWWSGTWQARRRPAVAAVTVGPSLGILVRGNTGSWSRLRGRQTGSGSSGAQSRGPAPTRPPPPSRPRAWLRRRRSGRARSPPCGRAKREHPGAGGRGETFLHTGSAGTRAAGSRSAGNAYCWGYDGFSGTFRTGDGVRVPAWSPAASSSAASAEGISTVAA